MARVPHEATNVPNTRLGTGTLLTRDSILAILGSPATKIGDYHYPPQSPQNLAQSQELHGVPIFVGGWVRVYFLNILYMAEGEDAKTVENWGLKI